MPQELGGKLGRAFRILGERMPIEAPLPIARSVVHWGRMRVLGAPPAPRSEAGAEALRVLFELHYQNARLGNENARPLRLVQSSVSALEIAERLGAALLMARGEILYGFVLVAIGRRAQGMRRMRHARTLADKEGDPITVAFCLQVTHAAACWAGNFDEAVEIAETYADTFGNWVEPGELCAVIFDVYLIETLRGRFASAQRWIRACRSSRSSRQAAVTRLRRGHLPVCACDRRDARCGGARPTDGDGAAPGEAHGPRAFFGMLTWGPRLRCFSERAEFGPDFETLLRDFAAEKYNPKKVHPALNEWYIALAEARMHQCLRASGAERARRVRELRDAVRDLRACARLPLFRAHRLAFEGALAWLEGDPKRARKRLDEAEALAEQETAPWVLYTVARVEAHMLLAAGKDAAAADKARMAAILAQQHGAVHRVRFIAEELGVELTPAPSSEPGSTRPSTIPIWRRRQLRSLVALTRASSRSVAVEQQAEVVLDEVVQACGAARAVMSFHGAGAGAPIELGRDRDRAPVTRVEPTCHTIMERVRQAQTPWSPASDEADGAGGPLDPSIDASRILCVPMFFKDDVAGVLYLDREPADEPFTEEDAGLLVVLAQQAVIALELARSMGERERLSERLQQATKLEAVGQLAGGVAHDFNNTLTAIRAGIEALSSDGDASDRQRTELEIVRQAVDRSASLTQQLLAFSRRQVVMPRPHDLGEVLSSLRPMMQRLIGEHIEIRLETDPGPLVAKLDGASLEHAVVNLAVNARDAMPDGGTLTLSARRVELDAAAAAERGIAPGPHVCVEVRDTGCGMSPSVKERIFEPFFTTKPLGRGTGLGLATVYGLVQQSAGHIEVTSEVGRGTCFALYFPASSERPEARHTTSVPPASSHPEPLTILLVEDDALVRRSIRRVLEREGYGVLVAGGAEEALAHAKEHGDAIDLVITDVLMPGGTGPELVRKLDALSLRARVLFVSGYTDGELVDELLQGGASFLAKPFSPSEPCTCIQALLESREAEPAIAEATKAT